MIHQLAFFGQAKAFPAPGTQAPSEFLFIDTIAPDALRGSFYGAQNLAAFGGAMSPVICGYLLINAAPVSMFYALGALTAIGGTLCFLSGRRVADNAISPAPPT